MNIVTAILKQNEKINQKLTEVDLARNELFISCITYYEIKRGLIAVNATRQLANFEKLCTTLTILFLDDLRIVEKAAEIYANLKTKGSIIQDADIFIAATAITRDLTLVSHDTDLARVKEVKLANWLQNE
ncbi:PIN domain-containing protein [Oscillatoria salina]|uniref:PIN domain-containing protein n=1 Tax=Oscillatoria salina TaxID=331517 RepID=UPI0013BA6913|nr:PIN domain-containing protein [Oscillatoria salina]MBZ8180003.1 type II toxin-antitoxin system VapC family toxin [Oscillatoria salina IIICB1]NET91116.1 type II toxin-antitoxin system VapC family toxin [Kamptonema sp. SIO1D9]